MTQLSPSAVYIRDAMDRLPAALAGALEVPLPSLSEPVRRVLSTGIGLSEGPARLLASLLTGAGVCARFCVTSQVAEESRSGDLLVVFSQGLSPNARLALGDEVRPTARWLVTSIDPTRAAPADAQVLQGCLARGVRPIVVPPAVERGTLVRLVGPTVAALTAMRLAASISGDAALAEQLLRAPQCYRALPRAAGLDDAALGLVAVGMQPEWLHPQRWKLLETLRGDDPPVWEVLQFAHGPLQAFFERRLTLLVFEANAPSPLVERLERTLHPTRHRLMRVSSRLAPALAFFEHSATLDALLLEAVQARGCDLFEWPARDGDGPLYDLGKSDA
jgi:hypothetical protein